MGIIICASYRKELCEILMERWTMPRMLPWCNSITTVTKDNLLCYVFA